MWLTPPSRRRMLLSLAVLGVGTVTMLQTLAKHTGLPLPIAAWQAVLVVMAQFLLLWLVYRAAMSYARLPACPGRCAAIRNGRCMPPTG